MAENTELKDTPSLVVAAFRQFTQLMQDEMTLAKAEISRNLNRAGSGIAMMAIAAILAITALNVLAGALVAYLARTEWSAGTAASVVGGVILVIAVAIALMGRSRLTASALSPDRAVDSVSKDLKAMKEATNA